MVRTHADKEDAPAILCKSEILCVQHSPFNAIARRTVARELIPEEVVVLAEGHPVYVLDHEALREN
ncbi:MAG TPA: hypothetical protein VNY24_03385 [Candidatus Acidoferrales bacterium]|nr:hypothetical protein [Candidatus Acidoferrales bacterium]